MKEEGVCCLVIFLLHRQNRSDGITNLLTKCRLAWAKYGRRLVGPYQNM